MKTSKLFCPPLSLLLSTTVYTTRQQRLRISLMVRGCAKIHLASMITPLALHNKRPLSINPTSFRTILRTTSILLCINIALIPFDAQFSPLVEQAKEIRLCQRGLRSTRSICVPSQESPEKLRLAGALPMTFFSAVNFPVYRAGFVSPPATTWSGKGGTICALFQSQISST